MLRFPLSTVCVLWVLTLPVAAQSVPTSNSAKAQPQAGKVTNLTEIVDLLNHPVDMKTQQVPMRLKEAFQVLQDEVRKSTGKLLPIVVDVDSFYAENPDAPPVFDTECQFPGLSTKLTSAQMLRYMLKQVVTHNATFVVLPTHVKITTFDAADPRHQVAPLMVREKVSRAKLLREIGERTGVTVVIDPKCQKALRKPMSVTFLNNVSALVAFKLVANTAGLQAVAVGRAVYVTTPENAEQFIKGEQFLEKNALDAEPLGKVPHVIPGPQF